MKLKRFLTVVFLLLIARSVNSQVLSGNLDSLTLDPGVPMQIKIVPGNLIDNVFSLQLDKRIHLKVLKITAAGRQYWIATVKNENQLTNQNNRDAVLILEKEGEILFRIPDRLKQEPEVSILFAPQFSSNLKKKTFQIKLFNGQKSSNSRNIEEFRVRISK